MADSDDADEGSQAGRGRHGVRQRMPPSGRAPPHCERSTEALAAPQLATRVPLVPARTPALQVVRVMDPPAEQGRGRRRSGSPPGRPSRSAEPRAPHDTQIRQYMRHRGFRTSYCHTQPPAEPRAPHVSPPRPSAAQVP
jgi:hypothetical protein